MRKFLTIVLSVLVFSGPNVFAEEAVDSDEKGHVYLRAGMPLTSFGFDSFTGSQFLKKGTPKYTKFFSFAIGYDLNDYVGLEADFGLLFAAQVMSRFYLMGRHSDFQPYLLAGGGYYSRFNVAFSSDYTPDEVDGYGGLGGVGLRFNFSERFCLNSQVYLNAVYLTRKEGDSGKTESGMILFPQVELVGFEWKF